MRGRMLVLSVKEREFADDKGKVWPYTQLQAALETSEGLGDVVDLSGVAGLDFRGHGSYMVDVAFIKRDKGFRVRVLELHKVGNGQSDAVEQSPEDYLASIEEAAITALQREDTTVPMVGKKG